MNKVQLPRKWAGKKTTKEEETKIEALQREMGVGTPWLQAKHVYFESREQAQKATKQPEQAQTPVQDKVRLEGKERATMTISESKLGVTLVLSKGDCLQLGFEPDAPTKAVVKWVRVQLKLPDKKVSL